MVHIPTTQQSFQQLFQSLPTQQQGHLSYHALEGLKQEITTIPNPLNANFSYAQDASLLYPQDASLSYAQGLPQEMQLDCGLCILNSRVPLIGSPSYNPH